jgi:uncharacterized membrane protein
MKAKIILKTFFLLINYVVVPMALIAHFYGLVDIFPIQKYTEWGNSSTAVLSGLLFGWGVGTVIVAVLSSLADFIFILLPTTYKIMMSKHYDNMYEYFGFLVSFVLAYYYFSLTQSSLSAFCGLVLIISISVRTLNMMFCEVGNFHEILRRANERLDND